MAYPKQKDAIFAAKETSEFSGFEKFGYNFLRVNKFGVPVYSKSGILLAKTNIGFMTERLYRKLRRCGNLIK